MRVVAKIVARPGSGEVLRIKFARARHARRGIGCRATPTWKGKLGPPKAAVLALEAATSARGSKLFDPMMQISSRCLHNIRQCRIQCIMHGVIETGAYLSDAADAGLSEAECETVTTALSENPMCGDLMPGTGGARKCALRLPVEASGPANARSTTTVARTFPCSCSPL